MADSSQRGGRAGGRARGLSADTIVEAALHLIDSQGIGAATMRAVADRLEVQVMALYHYVDNRQALFDAIVDKVVDELNDDPVLADGGPEDWREYLTTLAKGVRRYARAHPHAFPLVATRPPAAPWINPPLRSLRWIETLLDTLSQQGFSDEDVLFVYRSFNSFLLGFLLLETSAMALDDPKPGDGSFQAGDRDHGSDPVDPSDPVPGQLSATRTSADRRDLVGNNDDSAAGHTPAVAPDTFPTIHRLREGLTEDHYEREFDSGLATLLDRIEAATAPG